MAKIKELLVKLKSLQDNEDFRIMGGEKRVQQELKSLLDKEDLRWKQRAKKNRYAHGDRNTKFFYTCATQRRQENFIQKISTGRNQTFFKAEEIKKALCAFFDNLFTSSNPSNHELLDAWIILHPGLPKK